MRGRPKAELVLSESEREQLQALTLRRKTAQAVALRARIVLACADGMDNKAVAVRNRVTQIKDTEQQSVLALHTVRQGFVKARTAQANQIRGLLSEFGLGPVNTNREVHRRPKRS